MKIVDIFLNALQNIIDSSSTIITEYENSKNKKMQIKNILYKYEILNNKIKLEDLVSFNDEEIKTIFNCLDSEKKDILYKTYSIYKPLVEMYQKIKDKYEGDFEAPQYNEASKWLNDIVNKINAYIKDNQTSNSQYIESLKNENETYTKYYSLFNGNELIKPINDLKEFNSILDKLNFNDHEKYEIKKFIGIGHIKLLSSEYNNTLANELDKYKVIIKSKKNKYLQAYNQLCKEENFSIETVDTFALAQKLQQNEYDIRQALTVIFMEEILDKVKNNELKVNEAIVKLESIIDFSHKTTPTDDQKVIVASEDENIIKEANDILINEKELVNSIDEEEFSKYLAQSFTEDNEQSIKYQIVSILLALHGELEKYNNAKELDKIKNMIISNIKDYIEAYKTLKNKLNTK